MAKAQGKTAASRENKKTIAGHFDIRVSDELKTLGIAQRKSMQALLAEAINLLFKKYGKEQIAE